MFDQCQYPVRSLILYYQEPCADCLLTRQMLRMLSLDIQYRNISEPSYREILMAGSGCEHVPCLQITKSEGHCQWICYFDDIIVYIKNLLNARCHHSSNV
ncbi:MAG: glutaredoxin domain-containing protein [Pseudomonadota bacterium]